MRTSFQYAPILSWFTAARAPALHAQTRTPVGTEPASVWLDANRDGLLDLFTTSPQSDDLLLVTLGDGFVDGTAEAGLERLRSNQVVPEDWNGDGTLDLLLVQRDGSLRLLAGTAGSFRDATTENGLALLAGVEGIDRFDLETDGLPDLWVRDSSSGGWPPWGARAPQQAAGS